MAKLILTAADAGKTIPVAAGLSYDIVGTSGVDTFSVAAGANATINGGAGVDVITLAGNPSDYTVKASGSTVIFTYTDGSAVRLAANAAGDTVKFGNGATANLAIASGAVKLGEQTVDSTAAAVTGATGGSSEVATFKIVASAASVNEGETASFVLSGGTPNTDYAYKITGVGTSDVTGELIGTVTTDADGKATISVPVKADATTEGAETLTVSILATNLTASSTVTDSSTNAAPVVTADQTFNIAEGSADAAAVGTVAATDADSDAVTYAIASGNDAGYFAIDATTGKVTLTAAGAAALDYEGATKSYTLGVTATDAKGLASAAANVTVNVTDANDNTPVAVADAKTTDEDTVVTLDVLANDTDADAGATLSIKAGSVTVADAALGTAAIVDGKIVFTPAANASGSTTISYVTTDGTKDSAAGTATVTITAVNDKPVVASLEATTGGGNNASQITNTVTVSDVEANWNGATIVITSDQNFESAAPLTLAAGGFTLVGSSILANGNGDANVVISGGADAFIGTVSYSTAVDLDTDTADNAAGTKTITITLNSNVVTDATIQQLLRDIRVTDLTTTAAAPGDTQGTVTVTVTDAAGGVATFSRVMDDNGAMSIANMADDNAEIQVTSASDVAIDGGNAAVTLNGAVVNGMTINVTSSVSGDAIHAENTTGAGLEGQIRIVGSNVVYGDVSNGGAAETETVVGTVTGHNSGNMTITLNSSATTTIIDNILQGLEVNYATGMLGARTITTKVTSGDGLDVVTNTATKTLVGDFVNASGTGTNVSLAAGNGTGNALSLATILAATTTNKVTLNGNTYVSVDENDSSNDSTATAYTGDIAALIASGALTVASGAVIRFVTGDIANISDVQNLTSLGTLVYGNTGNAIDESLTLSALQAHGAAGLLNDAVDTITVNGVASKLDVDLSGFVKAGESGTLDANAVLTANSEFTGKLGSFNLDVTTGAFALTVAASKADGKDIDHEVSDAAADIIITGLDASFEGDLGELDTAQTTAGVVINVAENLTLDPDAQIDTDDLQMTVAQNKTLTITSDQATALVAASANVSGGGAAGTAIMGADATGTGNTGGSINVVLVDAEANSAGVQVGAINLTALTAGSIATGAASATVGSLTLNFTDNTTLAGTLIQGTATVTVASGKTLTAQSSDGTVLDLTGATITGAGNVSIDELEDDLDANLAAITVTGTKTANFQANGTFTGDIGSFSVSVDNGATFTAAASVVTGKTIAGDNTTAGGQTGGAVAITGVGSTAYDFSKITAGNNTAGGTAGTVTAQAEVNGNLTLNASTNLGVAALTVNDGTGGIETLTLTAAQAAGRVITDAANEGLTVTGLAADTDLSGIDFGGSGVVQANVDSSIDVSANTKLTDVEKYLITDATLTLTAGQAHGITFQGGDGSDTDTDNESAVVIAGDLAATGTSTLSLCNTTSGVSNFSTVNSITFDGNSIAVGASTTLNFNVADLASTQSVTGTGTVNAYGTLTSANLSGVASTTTLNAMVTASANVKDNANLGTVDKFIISDSQTLTVSAAQADVSGREFDMASGGTSGALTVLGTGADEDIDLANSSAKITMNAGSGDDIVTGGSSADSINGSDGLDQLSGGTGNDTLLGGNSDDTLTGGAGADSITGGAGADTIVLASAAADADTIVGFEKGSDVLDLSAALTVATLTIGAQVAFDETAKATTIASINTAADTDAPVYYIANTTGHAQVLSLAEIEGAIAAGDNATGEAVILIDSGTDTLVYFDLAAQTDSAGAGLILVGTLSAITGTTALATGDLISV